MCVCVCVCVCVCWNYCQFSFYLCSSYVLSIILATSNFGVIFNETKLLVNVYLNFLYFSVILQCWKFLIRLIFQCLAVNNNKDTYWSGKHQSMNENIKYAKKCFNISWFFFFCVMKIKMYTIDRQKYDLIFVFLLPYITNIFWRK